MCNFLCCGGLYKWIALKEDLKKKKKETGYKSFGFTYSSGRLNLITGAPAKSINRKVLVSYLFQFIKNLHLGKSKASKKSITSAVFCQERWSLEMWFRFTSWCPVKSTVFICNKLKKEKVIKGWNVCSFLFVVILMSQLWYSHCAKALYSYVTRNKCTEKEISRVHLSFAVTFS